MTHTNGEPAAGDVGGERSEIVKAAAVDDVTVARAAGALQLQTY